VGGGVVVKSVRGASCVAGSDSCTLVDALQLLDGDARLLLTNEPDACWFAVGINAGVSQRL